jgi:GMP synthase (glutamine-hydrolysing)
MNYPVAAVIRHIAFEGPASFGEALSDAGFELRHFDASSGHIDVEAAADADLLLVLGGPIGVGDSDAFPVLRQEFSAIERRLAADRPTLGICLGAQLIAHVLGAPVTAGAAEIGWSSLTLTTAGSAGPLRHLQGPVLHWHNDRFELPNGAACLASTASTPNQAFSHGKTLALQFHPEVTAAGLEAWYIGHHRGITANRLSVAEMRVASERHAGPLAIAGRRMLRDWLQSVGLLLAAAPA